MNLKSVAMASGLVLTFAAGAWLSTILLAPPQRSNREAAVDTAQSQPTAIVRPPKTLPELPASDSILPPLPPLPEPPAAVPPPPSPEVQALPAEPPAIAAQEQPPSPPVEQTVQPPEPPPPSPASEPIPPAPAPPPAPVLAEALPAIPEAPPAIAEAQPPEPQPTPVVEVAPPPTVAIPLMPAAEPVADSDIDPAIAALSALVARPPSASAPNALPAPPLPVPQPSAPAPSPAPMAVPPVTGPYFTIQVGSFQDPANAASLARSLGTKGWEAFVVDWTNGSGQVWKVVRVGRYLTEAQAAAASTELSSAANLRGNVIKVR